MAQRLTLSTAGGATDAGQRHTVSQTHPNDPLRLQAAGQLVTRLVEELQPHPSFARHHLNIPLAALSVVVSQGALATHDPIAITQSNVILKGYAQWELAKLQGREKVSCIKFTLSEEEALHWLLQSHRRSHILNDFARIVLALDLEPLLHEKARSNQSAGGQNKGSSILAKPVRMDVRSEIANAAAVSSGNVTKVKQLLPLAHPDVREALQLGELSIHRAWQWRSLPLEQQAQRLFQHQSAKGVRKTIRHLISQHLPDESRRGLALPELLRILQGVDGESLPTIQVVVVDTPGYGIMISKELLHAIDSQKELPL